MYNHSEYSLPDNYLARLDAGASRINEVWSELSKKGFRLTCSFFEFLDSLRIDDIEIEPRRFYFSEKTREILTLQFADWNPKNRKSNNLYYRSAYLDWIDERNEKSLFSYSTRRKISIPVDAAYARYLEISHTYDGPDCELYTRKFEEWKLQALKEASILLAQHRELEDIDLDKSTGIRHLMRIAFNGSGFSYDAERSKREVISYSRRIIDTDLFFVCTFEGASRFEIDWPWTNGIVLESTKSPLSKIKEPYPLFPILFDIEAIFPNCRIYLRHLKDPRIMKLGCFFYATALSLIVNEFDKN